ncbi:MAG: hypothetical protein H7X95_01765 [Deltaproteobacteria bacterium]|nr:hypothetical protein [Deltaproteobacteria bacterium]
MRGLAPFCVTVALLFGGCSGKKSQGPGPDAATDGPPAGERPRYLERLESTEDFGRVQGEGGEVKYLGVVTGRAGLPPVDKPCMFQNTALYQGHITFLKSFPELAHIDFNTYLNLVMKNASRQLWGGELKFFSAGIHPRTGVRGVLAYFLYADDLITEALTLDQIAEVDARLKGCVPYAKDLLVLVGMNETQVGHFRGQAKDLAGRGVDVIDPRALQPGGGAEGYSLGEGYGFLHASPSRLVPGDYGLRDVLVVESSSEDLSLVAGLVTALPQNLHSHVNLRLREKMIPNAHVPDIFQNPVVSLLEGKLVHLIVTETAVRIEPALLGAATAFWASRRPQLPTPAADLAEARLRPLDELRSADSISVGSKAANLGELAVVLPPVNAVAGGFAIPFSSYRDFMRSPSTADPANPGSPGTPGGPSLMARVETSLADPRMATDARFRKAILETLRKEIEAAPVDPTFLARLNASARAAFGDKYATTPLRFRSSSNVEDGAFISGAGLHDSARGCFADDADSDELGPSLCLEADERAWMQAELARRQTEQLSNPERYWLVGIIDDLQKDLTRERSVARALKKVYASLWNDRAYDEREYWGIDHRAAYMAIAVEPSFVLEKLDTVAVTNLDAGAGGALYRLVTQRDGQGVVRPADPTLVSETLTFRRAADNTPTDLRVLTMSSLSTDRLWNDTRLAELATLLFKVHDHFATRVYPNVAKLSLDMEIKMTRDDRIVIKQARPYLQQ